MVDRIQKRRRVYNVPGHVHYLTYSCNDRLPLLSKDRTRDWVIETVRTARARHGFDLYAYVIMPEHVHLALRPRWPGDDVSRILYDLKRPVSVKAKRWLQQTGEAEWLRRLSARHGQRKVLHFWQPGGGYDKNVWQERAITEIIDYIHANPVRRGLVERPTDWPWSSARYWAGTGQVLLEMDPVPV